ncbi:hypothetical protein FIBSPDRAFT_886744 [Athelia psychrophila]|uniref:Nephrocystin 3-like N-terminal domain-containing protein n=1 Tax=Athelia psychrophila TaxID=1759441 RepID=A0A166QHB8_9AGAM|nr:hypothetical protein FIBSPDRAFT_886744 [Fibularhizoctonia sp. CBS 109695]
MSPQSDHPLLILCKATVEDRSVQTESRLCTSSPEWKETFQIEARETSSVLSLQLFDSAFRSTSMICASVITISDLLQLCRHGKDAELNLRDIKSKLKGCIKIHFSLSSNGSWIVDEAQRWALVLSQQPKTAMKATGGYIDNIDGLLAVSVPTVPPDTASQSIANVLDKLSHFMRIADELAKIHPYAKRAWDILSAAHKIIVAQVAIDQSVADLLKTIQDVYGFVDAIKEEPSKIKLLEDIIERILNQTAECGRFIQEYLGHGFAGRLLRETMGASTAVTVAGMAQSLITLRGQFDTGLSVQIAIVCFRIQTDVNTILVNQTLDKLGSSGVPLARRSLDQCIPGTRRDVIDEILTWALHPSKGDNSNVFFLHGVAGIGKSAVAAAIATHLSKMDRLGAYVSFDRAPPGQSQPHTAVKALALQMAAFDERLLALIVGIINDRKKAPVLDALLPEQFDRLIVKPLASIPALAGDGAIVIVLDGLYECGQPGDWTSVLDLLLNQTKSLPSNVRFIITSRTVHDIYAASDNTMLHPRLRSRELRSSSHSDISAYFTFQMEEVRRNKHLQEGWQGPTAIAELSSRAFGFFPWAVNDTSRFVNAECPLKRLESLLSQPPTSISEANPALDTLYRAALDSVGDRNDPDFVSNVRAILGAVLASPIPLSVTAIHRLLDCPLSPAPPQVMVMIRRLGSVLSHGHVVQVLHPSFLDFLSSHKRCGLDWYFEHGPVRPQMNAGPATLCLQRMNAGLKHNICSIQTLSARLTTEVLPEELAYACESWVDHIYTDDAFESREMEKLMVIFLRIHLLHWFEAMTLLKNSAEMVPMLRRVAAWLEDNTFKDQSLVNLISEAIGFASKFAANIAEHPLYVYYVALPCCPSDSILYQLFHNVLSVDPLALLVPPHGPVRISAETAGLYILIMNEGLKRNICNMVLFIRPTTEVLPEVLAYACQSWVDHICTDGASGSWTMEELVVFLRTHLLHWFEAMSLLKKSEEIAPMLQRVATWLEENTFEEKSLKDLVIKAIDFAGKFAAEIAEHPLYVYYTALPLLPSHSILYRLFHDSLVDPSVLLVTIPGGMICLALSTNGRRIVTGSYDHAIIIRDTAPGEELVKMADTDGAALPFSVAFSYDGSHIACGTDESTVYTWDSVTGARVIGPLSHTGSSEYVNVVAWSTDGKCLLSGCRTGEVILWNITPPNGNQPITKIHHPSCIEWENPLSSLAFSSDGSQIASCSRRGDVHVWDSKTGGIMWSVQEPQGSDPSGGIIFVSSNTREFLVVKTKERTQVRDASTGDLCPLPDSLAGAVGLTRDDFMVNLLMKGIQNHYPHDDENTAFPEWVVQGEYFAFAGGWKLCHVSNTVGVESDGVGGTKQSQLGPAPDSGRPDVILQSAMTTHGLPEKLTTTDRCTSRPSTARFFSRGSTNGADGPNVAEVASNEQERNEMRCNSQRIPSQPRILLDEHRPGGPRDELNGCISRITGSNDKQGFSMKQGARLPYCVKLLCDGHSCYRSRRTDDPERKYVRGCIVNTIIGIVEQGGADVLGLPDNIPPKRLVPMPPTTISRFFSSSEEDGGGDEREEGRREAVHQGTRDPEVGRAHPAESLPSTPPAQETENQALKGAEAKHGVRSAHHEPRVVQTSSSPLRPDDTRNIVIKWKCPRRRRHGSLGQEAIGVSNFQEIFLEEILPAADITPTVNQRRAGSLYVGAGGVYLSAGGRAQSTMFDKARKEEGRGRVGWFVTGEERKKESLRVVMERRVTERRMSRLLDAGVPGVADLARGGALRHGAEGPEGQVEVIRAQVAPSLPLLQGPLAPPPPPALYSVWHNLRHAKTEEGGGETERH